jgi:hypothetical protein
VSYRSSYRRSRSNGPSVWALLGLILTVTVPAVIVALVLAGVIR